MNSSNSADSSATPAVSRRQIREATVQLLHATQAKQESEAGDPWPLILAQPNGKITRTRARAILHLQQNRPGRLKPLFAQRITAPPLLESFLDEKSASRQFRSLLKAETELPDLFDLLRRQLKSEKEPETLTETLERLREHNQTSLDCSLAVEKALGPAQAIPEPLRPLAKALPPLLESAQLLRALFSQNLPERGELKALREALAERDQLRAETEKLHQLVLTHLPSSDKLIAAKLENFAPERLAQVDRAVLRLAATELQHCPDIPPAVSINEGIEVARRFGGSDSAKFVNGILDKLK